MFLSLITSDKILENLEINYFVGHDERHVSGKLIINQFNQ